MIWRRVLSEQQLREGKYLESDGDEEIYKSASNVNIWRKTIRKTYK